MSCRDLTDFPELRGFAAEGVGTALELRRTLANGRSPAIIILAVELPDGNGFELAAEIRTVRDCGIIMLTALGASDDRIRGFESGADIHLVKDSTLREIEAAVRSLLRRTGEPAETNNRSIEPWTLDSTNWMLIAPNQRSFKLTASEFAFLNALCAHPGDRQVRAACSASSVRR